jgi:hypothetical protein
LRVQHAPQGRAAGDVCAAGNVQRVLHAPRGWPGGWGLGAGCWGGVCRVCLRAGFSRVGTVDCASSPASPLGPAVVDSVLDGSSESESYGPAGRLHPALWSRCWRSDHTGVRVRVEVTGPALRVVSRAFDSSLRLRAQTRVTHISLPLEDWDGRTPAFHHQRRRVPAETRHLPQTEDGEGDSA